MTNYLLVHGGDCSTDTWNKTTMGQPVFTPTGRMGYRVWDYVSEILRKQGHKVFAPSLLNEFETDLTGHINQICSIINDNSLQEVILVGHSYGGMIITGVADKMPERIKHLFYIDAAFPDSGHSLLDLIRSADFDPMAIQGLDLAPAYTEKLFYSPERIKPIPKTYVPCTKSELRPISCKVSEKIAHLNETWTIIELPTGHLAQATMPSELSEILLKFNQS